jgi:hypothetical protein
MAKETVKLPRSSYEELGKVIQAYAKLEEAQGLDEVASLAGMNKTRVSDNNAFLSAVGLIEGGKKKLPTPICLELGHALQYGDSEEVAKKWALVVTESDFLKKILAAIGIRKGMEEGQLETHIAYTAGETKSDAVMTGARTVVDILRASGLVVEEGGQIKLSSTESAAFEARPASTLLVQTGSSGEKRTTTGGMADVSLVIELRINATPSELEGLGEKIRNLVESIRAAEKTIGTDTPEG